MLISRVAYRFAKSLLQFSIEKEELEVIVEEMRYVNRTCKENKDLVLMLESPVIKMDKKLKVFTQIFGDRISKTSMTFFNIVFRRNREELIPDITESFILQYKKFKNIHTVYIESAHELSTENKNSILEFLSRTIKDDIELIENINEDLIGGVILRIDDLQIDASVKHTLNNLDKEFAKDLYSVKY